MLKKNITYSFMLFLFFGGFLFFSFDTLKKQWRYFSLDSESQTFDAVFKPKKISEEKYAIKTSFSFESNLKKVFSKAVLKERFYRNEFAANLAIKKKSLPLIVYYSKKNPEESATLEKKFPFKETFYSLILAGSFLYFIGLGYYLKR